MTKTMWSLYTPSCNFLESAKLSVEAKAILTLLNTWPETEKKDGHCTARQIQYYLHLSETRYRKHMDFLENEGYVETYSTRCLGQKRSEIVTVKEEAVSPEPAPNGIWSVVSDPNIPITAKVVYAYLHRMAKNGEGEFQLGKMLLDLGISGNTARRYLRLLAQSSLIEVCHDHQRRSQSPWAFSIP